MSETPAASVPTQVYYDPRMTPPPALGAGLGAGLPGIKPGGKALEYLEESEETSTFNGISLSTGFSFIGGATGDATRPSPSASCREPARRPPPAVSRRPRGVCVLGAPRLARRPCCTSIKPPPRPPHTTAASRRPLFPTTTGGFAGWAYGAVEYAQEHRAKKAALLAKGRKPQPWKVVRGNLLNSCQTRGARFANACGAVSE